MAATEPVKPGRAVEQSAAVGVVLRGLLQYQFARGLTTVAGLVAGVILPRVLGPTQSGELSVVTVLAANLATVAPLGMGEALARFVPGMSDVRMRRGVYEECLFITLMALLLIIIVGGVLAGHGVLPGEVEAVRWPLILLVVCASFVTLNTGMLRGLGSINVIALVDFTQSVLPRLLSIPIVLFVSRKFTVVVDGILLLTLVALLMTFVLLRRHLEVRLDRPVFLSRSHLAFAGTVLTASLIGTLIGSASVFFLRALVTAQAVGIFVAGISLMRLGQQLMLAPLPVPLLYHFSRPGAETVRRQILSWGLPLLGGLILVWCFAVMAIAPILVPLVLGVAYLGSVSVLQAIAPVLFFSSCLAVLYPYFSGVGRPQQYLYATGAILATLGVLEWVLVPRFGAIGAAAAEPLAYLLPTLWLVVGAGRSERVSLVKPMLVLTALGAVSVLVGYLTSFTFAFILCCVLLLMFYMRLGVTADRLRSMLYLLRRGSAVSAERAGMGTGVPS